ncbi:hypothetical protein ACTXL1_06930 [Psychrobacter celer]|uniref:hypothetical protein n=1 Tax=Psychrobacter celer TaxID=306572 RepID=UPI003FD533EC
MMIDDRTPNFNLPLPNSQNLLTDDVARISAGITAIDAELHAQTVAASDLSNAVSNQLEQAATDTAEAIGNANQQTTDALNKIKILALAGL